MRLCVTSRVGLIAKSEPRLIILMPGAGHAPTSAVDREALRRERLQYTRRIAVDGRKQRFSWSRRFPTTLFPIAQGSNIHVQYLGKLRLSRVHLI
jgi:hypothetical protein